ncbi:M1 family aminopeptidase [Terriglobus sp. TAA 43]|uniref:M1 family aminopeptidase n=1 Tax=Terriglobus sp. TAA 43 TaxID=278961 RepID=UPI000648E8C5|nr:M1 family aminopeptidase [Terriglobus sp. TAA 43]
MPAIRTTLAFASAALLALGSAAFAQSSTRPPINVTGYAITAEVDPTAQRLTATAQVTFTANQDITSATFELNNGLRITKITGPGAKPLDSDRDARRSTVTVSLPAPMASGTSATFTFTYAGILKDEDTSPVEGIKLAAIADPVSILLYPGRWFPMVGLYTNRFTMDLKVTVPEGETAVSSGFVAKKAMPANKTEFDFAWTKPGLPGTLVIGKFLPAIKTPDARQISVYVTEKHKANAAEYAATAAQQQEFFTQSFGAPESGILQIVEIPDDSVSASWGPEVIAIAGNRIGDKNSHRLLANTIAHQWFGSAISPATLNDAWITNGMARYGELMNLEENGGKTALQTAMPDIEAGALAYDTQPLTTLARIDPFSPQFQSMTLEKGAMVFHMLRYQFGDDKFLTFLKNLLSTYRDKPVRTADLENIAKLTAGDNTNLTPFFAQWLDGTGSPTFQNKYTVYRLGGGKGFRTVGAVAQDLDLFRMPVDLRIETDGKTETRKIDVSGTDSAYTIETFGRPRRIVIDPDNWILKSTPDLAVRVAVLKGQQLVAQGDLIGALAEYQKALDTNKNSSLATYRIAEIFFTQRNYQSAANSYRDALRGDGDPRWTQVWSHIGLGKIFDITGQRDRAVQEYRLAVQTNDNTQGAINEARALLQKPYERPRATD